MKVAETGQESSSSITPYSKCMNLFLLPTKVHKPDSVNTIMAQVSYKILTYKFMQKVNAQTWLCYSTSNTKRGFSGAGAAAISRAREVAMGWDTCSRRVGTCHRW